MCSKGLLLGCLLCMVAHCYAQEQDATVKFKDVTIVFKGMAIDPQAAVNNYNNIDTMSFNAWIGYKLTPGLISIQSNYLSDISIRERFETSVTIMNDGQHCDLVDWEHYLSPWQKISGLQGGIIRRSVYHIVIRGRKSSR